MPLALSALETALGGVVHGDAELKLPGVAGPAVATLEDLVPAASRKAVRLAAARDLVDRSIKKAREQVEVAASFAVKRPW